MLANASTTRDNDDSRLFAVILCGAVVGSFQTVVAFTHGNKRQ